MGQALVHLVEFVLNMKEKLKMFNAERQLHLQLRAGVTSRSNCFYLINQNVLICLGISVGPLTVGVVGARKPVLDVWGYTVHLTNLMEASGRPDAIQVNQVALSMGLDFRCLNVFFRSFRAIWSNHLQLATNSREVVPST